MKYWSVAAVGFMGLSGLLSGGLSASISSGELDKAGLDAHESHASASLLGQFRTSFSSWLWLRTDLYLHNGVEMRQMTDAELESGLEAHDAHEDHQIMDESTVVSVIPERSRDFRGWFGDVERATQAYTDMRGHAHHDPEAALPLFRLMTWVDPSFTPGWVVGASVLGRGRDAEALERSEKYLLEGLAANPSSIEILVELGRLRVARLKDFEGGLKYLERARSVASSHVLGRSEDADEALLNVYRWLGLCYREMGDSAGLQDACSEGLELFPEDMVLARLRSQGTSAAVPPPALERGTSTPGPSPREAAEHTHGHSHGHSAGDSHGHGHDHGHSH